MAIKSNLSDVIKELQSINLGQDLVMDTLDDLNVKILAQAAADFLKLPILETGNTAENTMLAQMNDVIGKILPLLQSGTEESLENIKAILSGGKLQEEENRRELVDVLENIEENTSPRPDGPQIERKQSGGIFGFFLFQFAKQFKGIVDGFGKFIMNFKKVIMFIPNSFKSVFGKLAEMFGKILLKFPKFARLVEVMETSKIGRGISSGVGKISQVGTSIGKVATRASSFVKNALKGGTSGIGTKVAEYFKSFGSRIKQLGELGKLFKDVLPSGLLSNFGRIGEFFGKFMKIGKLLVGIGKAIPVLGQVIMFITGIVGAVMGAIKGYKTEGIIGAIKEGLIGLTEGLIGGLVRLLADIAGWILGKLGFKELGKTLGDSVGKMIDGIYETFRGLFDMIIGIFTLDGEKIKTSFVKMAESWFDSVLVPFWNIADSIGKDVAGILQIDDIMEWMGFTFTNVIDTIKKSITAITDALMEWVDKINPFGESTQEKVKAKEAGYKTYKEYEESGFKFKNQSNVTASALTPEQQDKDKKWKNSDLYKTMSPEMKAKFESERAKTIQAQPSKKGAYLMESSAKTASNPIVINQMGGNVSNTSVSTVSNNSSSYESMVTGSSLGLTAQ